MRAAVFYGKKDVRVEEVPEPTVLHPEKVKIKVHWCGICGSDMEEYLDGPVVIPSEPHPLTGQMSPLVLGHEFSGEVVARGEHVSGISVGDNMVVNPILSCGECYWCKRNLPCLCEKMACMGLQANGAFAEYVIVPSSNCYHLPAGMSLQKAALVEPCATAVRAVEKAEVTIGDNVVVIGAGTIGLLTLQVARIAGARRVIVVEVLSERIQLAKKLGATVALNPNEDDVEKKISDLTNGAGPKVIIECAGNDVAPPRACSMVRKGGKVILIGISSRPSPINTTDIVRMEKKIFGCHGYDDENFGNALALLASGKVEVDSLITARIKLENIVEQGFERLCSRPEKNIKIMVSPQ